MASRSPAAEARSLPPAERARVLTEARRLFNAGRYWEAHESLETVWRSVSGGSERRVWQGLIQAAAALLHRERGNAHGVRVVGAAALEKLAGPQLDAVEFETVAFRGRLRAALAEGAEAPNLQWRSDEH